MNEEVKNKGEEKDMVEEYKERVEKEDDILRDKMGRFKKGKKGGPGKPEGTEHYAVTRRRALRMLAKQEGLDEDDIEVMLVADQIRMALTTHGHLQLAALKDAADRKYGTAKASMDLDVETDNDYLAMVHEINAAREEARRSEMTD